MSETVTRHRGQSRSAKGKYEGGAPDKDLPVLEIAPGGGSRVIRQARDGEQVSCTVFFDVGADVKDGDDLTVRGQRYRTIVNVWAGGGVEVLCVRGQG